MGTPYNLGKDPFDIIINCKKSREIRLAMLKGERPPDCVTCWTKEDMGAPSKRTVSNKMYEGEFDLESARIYTDDEGNTDWQPSYWDLRFGNLCNLKCVMCHPASSSQWYEDYVLLNGNESFVDAGTKINLKNINGRYKDSGEYNWWDNLDFWNRLRDKIPFLKQIYLVGGEPLLIEPHYDFLQTIVDSKRSKDVVLEYDTNLTSVQPRTLEIWKNFKKVWLRISLDDFGDQFNYVRYPANWNQITKNLEKIYCDIPNLQVDFTVTWQVLTVYTVPNLLRFLSKFRNSNVSIRILSQPDYFDAAILPLNIKKELITLYQDFKKENNKINVNHLIKYLETNPHENCQKVEEFLKIINKLDQIRNTDWKKTFEQLAEKFI
jgi:organic radical activating enzyme